MNYLKKIWLWLLGIVIICGINFSDAIRSGIWWKEREVYTDIDPTVDETVIDGTISEWSKSFSERIKWIISVDQPEDYSSSLWYVMSLIQVTINWLLGILAFIALVYMLYCGFLIFSSGSEDKNAWKWKKWITTAAIALAWIWLSWLIISAIIWFINNIAWAN